MMAKKRLLVLITVAITVVVLGVYAYTQLSNTLSGNFNVVTSPTSLSLSWVGANPNGATFSTGTWYQYYIELKNPTAATYNNVTVYFTIACGPALPSDAITLQYWTGSAWATIPLTIAGGTATGTFGPPMGFTVGPGYDVTTLIQILFNGDAPLTSYSFNIVAAGP